MKFYFTLFLIVFYQLVFAQYPAKCTVYQYSGPHHFCKKKTLIITYNKDGKITSEKFRNYSIDIAAEMPDGESFLQYKDTLLIQRLYLSKDKDDAYGDSTKMLCFYNEKDLRVREDHFAFKKWVKDSSLNKSNLSTYDYESAKRWGQYCSRNFQYDDKNRLIEQYSPKIYMEDQNRFTWKYNDDGRVIEERSFEDTLLLYIKNYNYFKASYSSILNWYNYEGKKDHSILSIFKVDTLGRVIEEQVTNDDSKKEIGHNKRTYNAKGLLVREESIDEKGKIEITHIYKYKY